MPLTWLAAAGRLPGKALAVAMVLWHLVGCTQKNDITFPTGRCARMFGVDRKTAARGLRALEDAGLVAVQRKHSRAPRVILLGTPATADAGDDITEVGA